MFFTPTLDKEPKKMAGYTISSIQLISVQNTAVVHRFHLKSDKIKLSYLHKSSKYFLIKHFMLLLYHKFKLMHYTKKTLEKSKV